MPGGRSFSRLCGGSLGRKMRMFSFFLPTYYAVRIASRSIWRLTWIGEGNNNHHHVLGWWFWVGRLQQTGRQIRLISLDSIHSLIGSILFSPVIFFSIRVIFSPSIRFFGWESDAFPKWVLKCKSEVTAVIPTCDFGHFGHRIAKNIEKYWKVFLYVLGKDRVRIIFLLALFYFRFLLKVTRPFTSASLNIFIFVLPYHFLMEASLKLY